MLYYGSIKEKMMLQLINICKDYPSADETVHALRGVSLNFRRSEFVSILGPSGCGKTTLLNIVGGLDRYSDGDLYYFMDPQTYDQVPLNADKLPDSFKFVKEGMTCRLMSYKDNVFSVEPPIFVELEVTATEPGVRGNTATNVTKPATVETGAEVKVPIFINEGDVIKIDTRTCEYLERV